MKNIITLEASVTSHRLRQIEPEGQECSGCGDACWLEACELVIVGTIGMTNQQDEFGTMGPYCGTCTEVVRETFKNAL